MNSGISPAIQRPAEPALSPRSSWLRPKYFVFGFIGLMLAYVLVHDEAFLVNAKDSEWEHIASFKWWLLPHGLTGATAFLLGVLQFSDRLRQRFVKLHHILGYIYIPAVFIAAPAGMYIEYLDERLGFARSFTIETVLQGGFWMITTAIALWFILNGKVQAHRQWMTRSFGSGPLIFLEVRVIGGITGWENLGPHVNETIVWCCTASSILIADIVIAAQEYYRTRPAPTKPAREMQMKSGVLEAVPEQSK